MINPYAMPLHNKLNVVKSYEDFMRQEGVSQCLHRDLSPKQKVDEIIKKSYKMRITDS